MAVLYRLVVTSCPVNAIFPAPVQLERRSINYADAFDVTAASLVVTSALPNRPNGARPVLYLVVGTGGFA